MNDAGSSPERNSPADSPAPSLPDPQAKVIRSVDLFAGTRQIWIEHAGAYYRLSITSRGKLILQK